MANKTQTQEQASQQQTEQITFNMNTINRLINSDNYKERMVGEDRKSTRLNSSHL